MLCSCREACPTQSYLCHVVQFYFEDLSYVCDNNSCLYLGVVR